MGCLDGGGGLEAVQGGGVVVVVAGGGEGVGQVFVELFYLNVRCMEYGLCGEGDVR